MQIASFLALKTPLSLNLSENICKKYTENLLSITKSNTFTIKTSLQYKISQKKFVSSKFFANFATEVRLNGLEGQKSTS